MKESNFISQPVDVHSSKSIPLIDFAIIFFCPIPEELEKQTTQYSSQRYFIHSHPSLVRIYQNPETRILIISEVYGHAMISTTLKRLNYYQIFNVIGLGLAGSASSTITVGTLFQALAGTAHPLTNYMIDYQVSSDDKSEFKKITINPTTFYYYPSQKIKELFDQLEYREVYVYMVNSLYQETQDLTQLEHLNHQYVINMETASFYKILRYFDMNGFYIGVVSDHFFQEHQKDYDWSFLDQNGLITHFNNLTSILPDLITYVHLQTVIKLVQKLYSTLNVCPSHNLDHFTQVLQNSQGIPKEEFENDLYSIPKTQELVYLASYLHDVDDHKFFPTHQDYENTRQILAQINIPQEEIEIIIEMISYVSASQNGDSIPERAKKYPWLLFPRYSDRLEALGLVGIERCLQYSKTKGNPFDCSETPKVKTEEELWEIATLERYQNYNGKSKSMMDHFYDKLLRLGYFEYSSKYFNQKKNKLRDEVVQFVLAYGQRRVTDYQIAQKYIDQKLFRLGSDFSNPI